MQRLHIGSDLINYVTRLLIYHFISDKCLKVGMQPIELKKKTDFEVNYNGTVYPFTFLRST